MPGGDTDFTINDVCITTDPVINFIYAGFMPLCEGFNIAIMLFIYKFFDAGQCAIFHKLWVPCEIILLNNMTLLNDRNILVISFPEDNVTMEYESRELAFSPTPHGYTKNAT
jgi:hypothetical protein